MILRAISHNPLAATPIAKTLSLIGVSIQRNFLPKLIVVDKSGFPISNAAIKLVNGGSTYNYTSDSSGYVTITAVIRGLIYQITVSCAGYQTITSNLVIPNSFLEQTFVMFKSNSIVTTAKGYAVSLNPTNPENSYFN